MAREFNKTRGLTDRVIDGEIVQGYDRFIAAATNGLAPSVISFLGQVAQRTRRRDLLWVDYCGWDGRAATEAVAQYNRYHERSRLKAVVVDISPNPRLPPFRGGYHSSPDVSFVQADLSSESPDIQADLNTCIWGTPYIPNPNRLLANMVSHTRSEGGSVATLLAATTVDGTPIIGAFRRGDIAEPLTGSVNITPPHRKTQLPSAVIGVFRDGTPISADIALTSTHELEGNPGIYTPHFSKLVFY